MKITKLQFVNRDAFINGTTKTFVTNPDRAMGVVDITIKDDSVVILSTTRERILIPKSAVYITFDPEEVTVNEPLPAPVTIPAKRGRPPAVQTPTTDSTQTPDPKAA